LYAAGVAPWEVWKTNGNGVLTAIAGTAQGSARSASMP
jgi:hypothetical protein